MQFDTKIYGHSLGPQPHWPNKRGIAEIGELHEVNTGNTLEFCPNVKHWDEVLDHKSTVVDWGCGEGAFASELKKKRPDITLVGVSMHDVRPDIIKDKVFSKLYYGQMPKDLQFLDHWKGRVNAMVDTYGPMTWMDNPVEGLIYAALCLKKDGIFSSITSETRKDQSQSIFGNEKTWAKIKDFMRDHLKVNLVICPSKIKSQVFQGTIQRDYLVQMHKFDSVHYSSADFAALCAKAAKAIGTPKQGKVWWAPENQDPNLAIREKVWQTPYQLGEIKNERTSNTCRATLRWLCCHEFYHYFAAGHSSCHHRRHRIRRLYGRAACDKADRHCHK